MLERRCINSMKSRLKEVYWGAEVSGHQPTKDGIPYPFQHISWSDLASRIKYQVREIDPTKLVVVKAAILDCYTSSPKAANGGKKLPRLGPGEKRVSAGDDVPVSLAAIKWAQEETDTDERLRQAYHTSIYDKRNYMSPVRVKGVVKAFLNGTSGRTAMSKEELCSAMSITEEDLDTFFGREKAAAFDGEQRLPKFFGLYSSEG